MNIKSCIEIIMKKSKTNLTSLERTILKLNKKVIRKDNYIKRVNKVLQLIINQDICTTKVEKQNLDKIIETRSSEEEKAKHLSSKQTLKNQPIMDGTQEVTGKKYVTRKNTSRKTPVQNADTTLDDTIKNNASTNNATQTMRQKENNQKKERIKEILKENNIKDDLSNLDSIDIDILKEILINKPQGQPSSLIRKVTSEIDKREETGKEFQNNNRKRKQEDSQSNNSTKSNKQLKIDDSATQDMNTTTGLSYALTIECQKIGTLKDADSRQQQNNIWAKLHELKLKGLKHASLVDLDGRTYLKITTKLIDDVNKLDTIKRTNELGEISIKSKQIESKWLMICYGFKPNYNEEDEYEIKQREKLGIVRATRKTISLNEKAKSMVLEVSDNESFCELYLNGLATGTEMCMCEPKWKQVKFCKLCRQWDHYEDECSEEEPVCYKCCSGDHTHNMCREEPFCSYCDEMGLNAEHLTTSENECEAYKKHFNKMNELYLNTLKEFHNKVGEPFNFTYPKNMNLRRINSRLKKYESNEKISELEKKTNMNETKLKELQNKLQNLEHKVESNSNKITIIDSKLSSMHTKLDTVVAKTITEEQMNNIINNNITKMISTINTSVQENIQDSIRQIVQNNTIYSKNNTSQMAQQQLHSQNWMHQGVQNTSNNNMH